MIRSRISAEEILKLVDAFHAISDRLVNGVFGDRKEAVRQWTGFLGSEVVEARLALAGNDSYRQAATDLDRAVIKIILDFLKVSATERGFDTTRILDVIGNIAGASIEKWDNLWSCVQFLRDRAVAELEANLSKKNRSQLGKKIRPKVDDVDAALRMLVENDPDRFFSSTREKLAEQMEVSTGLVSKTPTWKK